MTFPKTYAKFNADGKARLKYTPQDGDAPRVGEVVYVPSRGGNRHRCVTLQFHATGTDGSGDTWYDISVQMAGDKS